MAGAVGLAPTIVGLEASATAAHIKDNCPSLALATAQLHLMGGVGVRFHDDQVTDVLICEVKTKGQLQFNSGLLAEDALASVLRWVGLVAEEDIQTCVQELLVLMQPGCPAERAAAGVILSGIVRIRPLLCSPARARARPNQPWFLSHAELFDWITTCFNPSSRRPTCATRYDFANWGPWLEPIVRYFKSLPPQAQGTMGDLYDAVLGQ
jgi:hypothetical protein